MSSYQECYLQSVERMRTISIYFFYCGGVLLLCISLGASDSADLDLTNANKEPQQEGKIFPLNKIVDDHA